MKRFLAFLLLICLISTLVPFPVSAAETDTVIDRKEAPFPADTTLEGNLIISGDCPDTIVLINVTIPGRLTVQADHPVTIHLQGKSTCQEAEILSPATLTGGVFGKISVDAPRFTLKTGSADTLEIQREQAMVSVGGQVKTMTLNGDRILAGGTGRAETVTVNGDSCWVSLRSGSLKNNGTALSPDTKPVRTGIQADFVVNPTVSPASSVVHASVTFSNVPEELLGDYRIYWYIGQTLSYYDWHFDLKSGASADFTCSAHFDGEMDVLPVWVRLVRISDDHEMRFSTQVTVEGYSTAEYETMDTPYQIHLLRNQGVVIIYGKDEKGEYSKIVNVFVCSVGDFKETALGDYEIGLQMRWQAMMGDVYAQYVSQFNYNQLFHSVPYWSPEPNNIEFDQYALLGSPASSGCVRLAAADARWIYLHCSSGTPVKNYDTDQLPVVKPIPAIIREDNLFRGWDPTDPDPDNPTLASNPPAVVTSVLLKGHPAARLCLR